MIYLPEMGDYGGYGGYGGGYGDASGGGDTGGFGGYGGYGDYQSGSGGGGFMQSSESGGFGTPTTSTPTKTGGGSGSTTITPVTLKLIVMSEKGSADDTFLVDGKEISRILVCGRVMDVNVKNTNVTYTISDTTAVNCVQWTEMMDLRAAVAA